MARQAAHPCLHSVEIFNLRNKAHTIHDLLDGPRLFGGGLFILIPQCERQGELAE
jgi:hypothetical protein